MSKKKNKQKADAWFVAIRGSYLPRSTAGWLTYVPYVTYLIFSGIAGFNKTNSVALAVLFIVPNWVAATVVMTYVAAHKS